MRRFVIAPLVLAGLLLPTHAEAADTAAGSLSFQGTAELAPASCTTSCTGTFRGQWAGELQGTWGNNNKYAVTWQSGAQDMSVAFSYASSQCDLNGPVLVSALGTGTATTAQGFQEVKGYWVDGGGNAYPILAVRMTFRLAFNRTGSRAAVPATVHLDPTKLEVQTPQSSKWITVVEGRQDGIGDFVPSSSAVGGEACSAPNVGTLTGAVTLA